MVSARRRDAVRIEEFLNYFRYDYPEPKGDAPFSVTTDLAVAPWATEHRLLRVGIKGRSLRTEAVPASNLVFLLDVSGSMQPPNKLPLVKQALPAAGPGAAAAGPGGDRGLRRRRRPGAPVHPRLGQGDDPPGASTGSKPAAPRPEARAFGSRTRSLGSTTPARATTG